MILTLLQKKYLRLAVRRKRQSTVIELYLMDGKPPTANAKFRIKFEGPDLQLLENKVTNSFLKLIAQFFGPTVIGSYYCGVPANVILW